MGRTIKINEARLTLDDYDEIEQSQLSGDSDDASVAPQTSPEDAAKEMKRIAIKTARLSGNYEGAFPEITENMKRYFPDLVPVSSELSVNSKKNSYYITDDETVIINVDVTKVSNINGKIMSSIRCKNKLLLYSQLVLF